MRGGWGEQDDDEGFTGLGDHFDDISGRPLDPYLVHLARLEAMDQFRKYGVYVKVPIKQSYERTGKSPIGCRWVDINTGDDKHPDYRSRLAAKEIKKGQKR